MSSCLELIKTAFIEREEEGLHYPCMDFTLDDYVSEMNDHQIFVAINQGDHRLLGLTSAIILTENTHKFALEHHSAVDPTHKGMGIGSALLTRLIEYAKDSCCDYVLATSAEKAKGSIAFHLKNGFYVIRSASYSNTAYYSVVMRKQLRIKTRADRKWTSPFYCRLRFLNSFFRTHIMKRANGSYSTFGKTIRILLKRDRA